jgi:thioredoxin-dependent peroxiredoxin
MTLLTGRDRGPAVPARSLFNGYGRRGRRPSRGSNNMKELHETDKAPAFKELAAHKGKTVVVYFYPRDDTPGCTTEACELRDAHKQIANKNAVVLGVSPDSVKSHDKFATKFNLPFSLVPDEDHKIALAYGVWKEKSMYGRKYMGIERTTIIIGPDGRIRKIFRKVKPAGHAAEVLTELERRAPASM